MIYIVTPCRNAVETIEQTILSVVSQAGNFEVRYHVQDGGSTDGTTDLLARWKSRIEKEIFPIQCNAVIFTYASEPDQSMYDGLVKGVEGLSVLSNDFMTWINADDLLMPGAFSFIQSVHDCFSSEHVSWISGAVAVMKNHLPTILVDRPLPTLAIKNGLCDGEHWEYVQQEGTFFRYWLWNKVDAGRMLRKFRYAGDWNLWREFAHHAILVQSQQWPLGIFRQRDGQLSQKHINDYKAEIEATAPLKKRREAFKRLTETQQFKRRMIRSKYPDGSFLLAEKGVNYRARPRYEKLFGTWSQSFIDKAKAIDQDEHTVFTPSVNPTGTGEGGSKGFRKSVVHIDLVDFQSVTFARRSHWRLFEGLDIELFGAKMDMDAHQLKVYQDLLVFQFIREYIPPGSRILDVGGGISRILNYFSKTHECWNIDKLEGLGNGPKDMGKVDYRLVRDYMGNFNSELPDNYFDFVFSISALEHVPQDDPTLFDKIIDDIDRVLKPGGYSLHLFDVIFKRNGFWTNKIIYRIFERVNTINNFIPPEEIRDDPDLYCMSEDAYNKTWFHATQKPYLEHGRPSNLSILWKKALPSGSKQLLVEKKMPVSQSKKHNSFRFYVVTPILNVRKTIDQTIESVVSQAGDFSIHYHIQDGGSTDGTLERLKYWESSLSNPGELVNCRNVTFTWSSQPDQGMYDAVTTGFDRMFIGPDNFMTWINGDDLLMPDALSAIQKISSTHPEIQWIGGPTYVIDDNGPILQRDNPAPTEIIREGLCDGRHWHHLQQEGMFFKKSLWFRGKHALQGFRLAGDWNLWRVFAHHAMYYQYSEALGAFRRRKNQMSIDRIADYQKEIDSQLPNDIRYQAFCRLYRDKTICGNMICLDRVSGKPILKKDTREIQKQFEYHWKNVQHPGPAKS